MFNFTNEYEHRNRIDSIKNFFKITWCFLFHPKTYHRGFAGFVILRCAKGCGNEWLIMRGT